MKRKALELASALMAGVLFGVGLAVSGMTRPAKVLGFLDLGGAWDASLLFVMAGAIATHSVTYRLLRGRAAPLCADEFSVPTRVRIDTKLLVGAAIFGVGWGIGGYCPGPGVVSLATGSQSSLVFVTTMLLGMLAAASVEALVAKAPARERAKAG
jgi:uncharacterized membrane protein YedE/YeeE